MAEPVAFPGCNLVLGAPEGREDVQTLHAFRNRYSVVSCWQLTEEERRTVAETGRIYLLILGRNMPPAFVGDERSARALAADYGPTWPRSTPAPRPGGTP